MFLTIRIQFSDINISTGNICQDVSAPPVVAGRSEPTPDKPPFAQYSDGLGGNLGGPAASEAPKGVYSLTHIKFGKF